MAVAVPILLSATGASAAIGAAIGVSAGLVTAGAGLLVGATGIGKSINKAASKVFGEDLVSFANLAGGIALAAGWNPSETWSSMTGGAASQSGGALSSAQDLSTTDIGIGGASAGGITEVQPPLSGTTTAGQPGGLEGLRSLESQAGPRSYESAAGAPARAAVPTGGVPKGALSTAAEWWDKQPDRTKAALITTGGQALAGVAQGWSQAKEAAEARKERRRREGIFQSGSGLDNTYAPRKPVQTGG